MYKPMLLTHPLIYLFFKREVIHRSSLYSKPIASKHHETNATAHAKIVGAY